jgi:hypothetical protein
MEKWLWSQVVVAALGEALRLRWLNVEQTL